MIELMVSVVNFQRRFCWQCSSLLQLVGSPDVVLNVAYTPNNGSPTTEDVIAFFRARGLRINETVLTQEQIGLRHIARNIQLQNTKADWACFIDADMVYHPEFFADLQTKLQTEPWASERRCITAERVSLDKQFSKDYFNAPSQETAYPCVIDQAAEQLSHWPIFRVSSVAGYFQMANVAHLRSNHGGWYCQPSDKGDNGWHTRTDKAFRKMLGGSIDIPVKQQFHLNHERPREEGMSHDIQR